MAQLRDIKLLRANQRQLHSRVAVRLRWLLRRSTEWGQSCSILDIEWPPVQNIAERSRSTTSRVTCQVSQNADIHAGRAQEKSHWILRSRRTSKSVHLISPAKTISRREKPGNRFRSNLKSKWPLVFGDCSKRARESFRLNSLPPAYDRTCS